MNMKELKNIIPFMIIIVLVSLTSAIGVDVIAYHSSGAGGNITAVYGVWPYLFNGSNVGDIYIAFNISAIEFLNDTNWIIDNFVPYENWTKNVNASGKNMTDLDYIGANNIFAVNFTGTLFGNATYSDNSNHSVYSDNAIYAVNSSYATTSNSSDYSNRTVYWDNADSKQDVVQWCYQGLVNKSTSCGGLGYGTYLCGDNWTDCNNTIDGDSDTYSTQSDYNQYLYINTTFPSNFLPDSLVQTKDGMAIATVNNSIASVCDLKQFRLFGQNSGGGITPYHIYYQCWNTTDWQSLRSKVCAQPCRVYDVGWWLHLNNTEQNKISYGEANETYLQKNGNGSQLTNVNAVTMNGKNEDALDVNNSLVAGVATTALYLEGFTYGQINDSAIAAANAFTSSQVGAIITNTSNFNVNNASWARNATSFDNELDFGAIGQNIIPSTDNAINLGSPTKRFASINALLYYNVTTIRGNPATNAIKIYPDDGVNGGTLEMYPSVAGESYWIGYGFVPDNNFSRLVRLQMNNQMGAAHGLILSAAAGEQSFNPAGDQLYDLGNPSLKWRNLSILNIIEPFITGDKFTFWFTGNYGSKISLAQIGSEYSVRWGAPNAYTTGIDIGGISTADGVSFTSVMKFGGNGLMQANGSIDPIYNNTHDLGSNAHKWRGVYYVTAYAGDQFYTGADDYVYRVVERKGEGLYTQIIPTELLSSDTTGIDWVMIADKLWNSTNKTKQGMDGNIVSYSGNKKTFDLKETVDKNKELSQNITDLQNSMKTMKMDVDALKAKVK